MSLKVFEALRKFTSDLDTAGISDAPLEAELLMAHSLGVDRKDLYMSSYGVLSSEALVSINKLLKRRLKREPISYIVQNREFFGLSFIVKSGVMVPRQETETLVEQALNQCQRYSNPVIVDVGTGSGVIAISLAVNVPNAEVYGIDISTRALDVVKENIMAHSVNHQVTLSNGDILNHFDKRADIIVANMPYLTDRQMESLQPEIRCYEPDQSLRGGEHGLELIFRLLEQSLDHVGNDGTILLEIDPTQKRRLINKINTLFPGVSISVVKDLFMDDRVVIVNGHNAT